MAFRDLLVHVDGAERTAERVDLAIALAKRFGARLTGLFAELGWLGPSVVGRRSREHVAQLVKNARSAFEAQAGAAGISARWWELEPGEYGEVVDLTGTCCRYVDLAIFGQHDAADEQVPQDLVEQVLLGCGRPVLVVPSVGHHPSVGRRVVVAWNGSREAARAVNDAIPLMRDAEAVTLLAFQRPRSDTGPSPVPALDIVGHLGAHGIDARYERVVVEEPGVADMILNRSSDLQADLMVMGCHVQQGLPRPRAAGSTREILGSMTAPVLMSL